MTSTTQLKPTLGTLHLWGIAVGLVISGEYFGWSYGWGTAGTLGFLVTALLVWHGLCVPASHINAIPESPNRSNNKKDREDL